MLRLMRAALWLYEGSDSEASSLHRAVLKQCHGRWQLHSGCKGDKGPRNIKDGTGCTLAAGKEESEP